MSKYIQIDNDPKKAFSPQKKPQKKDNLGALDRTGRKLESGECDKAINFNV